MVFMDEVGFYCRRGNFYLFHLQVLSLPERKTTQNKKAAERPYRYDFSSKTILVFFWAAAGRNCCSFQTHNLKASGKVKVMDSRKRFFSNTHPEYDKYFWLHYIKMEPLFNFCRSFALEALYFQAVLTQ